MVTDDALTQARRTRAWGPVADATAFGDVLAFGISEHGHVGVVTKRLHMLQVSEGLGTHETRYDAPAWGPLAYRHLSLDPPAVVGSFPLPVFMW